MIYRNCRAAVIMTFIKIIICLLICHCSIISAQRPIKCLKQEDLGGPCKTHFECYGLAVCRFGSCVCPDGFVERFVQTGRDANDQRTVCSLGPLNGEDCILGRCAPFHECNENFICECKNGTRPFGSYCFPDCPNGEVFSNGECAKVSALADSCVSDDQCWTAYSKCHAGRCTCINGTQQQANICVPEPKCPYGDPLSLKNINKLLTCKTGPPSNEADQSTFRIDINQLDISQSGMPWYSILEKSAQEYREKTSRRRIKSGRRNSESLISDSEKFFKAMVTELFRDDPGAFRNPSEIFGALFGGYGDVGSKLSEILLGGESDLAHYVRGNPYFLIKRLLENDGRSLFSHEDPDYGNGEEIDELIIDGSEIDSDDEDNDDDDDEDTLNTNEKLTNNPFVDVLKLLLEVPKELRKLSVESGQSNSVMETLKRIMNETLGNLDANADSKQVLKLLTSHPSIIRRLITEFNIGGYVPPAESDEFNYFGSGEINRGLGSRPAIVPNIIGGFGRWREDRIPFEVDNEPRAFPAAEFNIFSMLPSADYPTILKLLEEISAPCHFIEDLRDSSLLTGVSTESDHGVLGDANPPLPFNVAEIRESFPSLQRIVVPGAGNFSISENNSTSVVDVDFFVIENGFAAAERTYYTTSAETQLATNFLYALMYHLHELPIFLKTHFPGRVLDTLYLLDQLWNPIPELRKVLDDVYLATLGEEVSDFVHKGRRGTPSSKLTSADSKNILRRLFGPSVSLDGKEGLYAKVHSIAENLLPVEKFEQSKPKPSNDVYAFHSTPAVKYGAWEIPGSQAEPWTNQCPEGYKCLSSNVSVTDGVCCPEPSHFVKCPFGNKMKKAVCDPTISQLEAGAQRCPKDTHFCYHFVLNQHKDSICCPRRCPKSRPVMKHNQCYPVAPYLSRCLVTEQCDPENINGMECLGDPLLDSTEDTDDTLAPPVMRCACAEDSIFVLGICVKKCKSEEIPYRTRCLQKSKPLENCTLSSQCTNGSVCTRGICTCLGGSMLVDGFCIQEPMCPTVFGVASKAPIDSQPCQPGNGTDPCIPKGFCHPVSQTSGVCCQLPEPSCPFGGAPLRRGPDVVHMNNCLRSRDCGPGAICHQFWYTEHGSRVCCPLPRLFAAVP